MSKRILKLWIPAGASRARLSMPVGSRILDIQMETNDQWEDPNSICVWIEGDKSLHSVDVRVIVFDTGEQAPSDLWTHMGTCCVSSPDGPYVRHVYMFGSDLAQVVDDQSEEEDQEWPE